MEGNILDQNHPVMRHWRKRTRGIGVVKFGGLIQMSDPKFFILSTIPALQTSQAL